MEALQKELFVNFQEFKQKGDLCDVEVRVEKESFSLHKLLLAGASPFFKNLITNDPYLDVICLDEHPTCTALGFKFFTDFIYGEIPLLKPGNAIQTYKTSCALGCTLLNRFCTDFIKKSINPDTCLSFFLNLDTSSEKILTELKAQALKCIALNFDKVSRCEAFITISEDQLNEFLKQQREALMSTDIELFQACMRWHQSNAEHSIERSFENLKPEEMHPEFVDALLHSDFITKQTKVEQILLKGYFASSKQTLQQEIIAISQKNNKISAIDIVGRTTVKEHFQPPEGVILRKGLNTATCGSTIFFLGGQNQHDGTCSKDFFSFDIKAQVWRRLSSIRPDAKWRAMVRVGLRIYVVGGYSGITRTSALSTVDVYSITEDRWHVLHDFPSRAYGQGGCNSADGTIFISGGTSDGSNELNAIHQYHPENDEWTKIGSLLEPRFLHFFTEYSGKLFSVAGNVDERKFIEMFDLKTKQSSMLNITHTSIAECYCRAVQFQTGSIYALVESKTARRDRMASARLRAFPKLVTNLLVFDVISSSVSKMSLDDMDGLQISAMTMVQRENIRPLVDLYLKTKNEPNDRYF